MLKKTPKTPKIPKNEKTGFYCEKCEYFTSHKGDYEKHLKTVRHNANKCYKNAKENSHFFCACGRSYKHQSSFSRHTNTCTKAQNDDKMMTNGLQMDDAEKKEPIKYTKKENSGSKRFCLWMRKIANIDKDCISINKHVHMKMTYQMIKQKPTDEYN